MPRFKSPKWYVVRKGTVPGVYDSWLNETSPKVQDPDAVYQAFLTKADADAVWQQVVANSWAVVLGSDHSGSHSAGRASNSSRRPLGQSQSPSAIEGRNERPIVGASGRWYVVIRGRRTGVFPNWIQASVYVDGIQGSAHESFSSKAEAEHVYLEAQAAGNVRVIGARSSGSYNNAPNQLSTRPQDTLSTPPLTPKVEQFELDLRRLEDESEWACRIGAMSISSAAPAYHSSWRPSSSRTPPKPVIEDRRFPAPGPLTQHRSLPTESLTSPENSLLLQRAHSQEFTSDTPSGSATRRSRATVGSAPHLRGYTARKQLMPEREVLSPLSTPALSTLSTNGYRSPKKTLECSPSRGNSSTMSSPFSSGNRSMVTAVQTPTLDRGSPSKYTNDSPRAFDLREGTSVLSGANRTPRTAKAKAFSPPSDKLGLSDMHVPLTHTWPMGDIRSPLVEGTSVPTNIAFSDPLFRPSPSYSPAGVITSP